MNNDRRNIITTTVTMKSSEISVGDRVKCLGIDAGDRDARDFWHYVVTEYDENNEESEGELVTLAMEYYLKIYDDLELDDVTDSAYKKFVLLNLYVDKIKNESADGAVEDYLNFLWGNELSAEFIDFEYKLRENAENIYRH